MSRLSLIDTIIESAVIIVNEWVFPSMTIKVLLHLRSERKE